MSKFESLDWLDLAEIFNIVTPEEYKIDITIVGNTKSFIIKNKDEITSHLVCNYIESKLNKDTEKLDVEVKRTLREFISDLLEITKEQYKKCIYTCMLSIEDDAEFVTFIVGNIHYLFEMYEIKTKV